MLFREERYANDPVWKALQTEIEWVHDCVKKLDSAKRYYSTEHIVHIVLFRERDRFEQRLNNLLKARRDREAEIDAEYVADSISNYESALNDYEHEFNQYGYIRGTKL